MNRIFLPVIILILLLSISASSKTYSPLEDPEFQQGKIEAAKADMLDREILELFNTISLREMSLDTFAQKQSFKEDSVYMSIEELEELRNSLKEKLIEIEDIR
jgi:hypothetical protein